MRTMRLADFAAWPRAVLAALFCLCATGHASGQQAGFSGGATSLRETFQDWQLICEIVEGAPVCAVSQAQRDAATQQFVLAVELLPADGGGASGSLILPFGLRVAARVGLQIDEASPFAQRPFSTCLPVGCIVPVTFDADAIAALRAGSVLSLNATGDDDGESAVFSVSLMGFAAALERARTLTPG
jgi:invasion protein IalB